MPATIVELKADAIEDCDAEAYAIPSAKIDRWWDENTAKGNLIAQMYLKRRILLFMLGKLRKLVNVSQGQQRVDARGQFTSVREMLREINEEIQRNDPHPTIAAYPVGSTSPRPRAFSGVKDGRSNCR